jgi:hypothetical protein
MESVVISLLPLSYPPFIYSLLKVFTLLATHLIIYLSEKVKGTVAGDFKIDLCF